MRYFINKENGQSTQVGEYTPSILYKCEHLTKIVGKEIVNGEEVNKEELIYLEIDQATYEKIGVSIQWSVELQDFIPYTPPDFNKQERIADLKSNLAQTDYKAIKCIEGFITPEEYEPMRQQRQAWRTEINELERQIKEEQNI